MPSVSPSLLQALTDSSYSTGGTKWDVERALDYADSKGAEGEISTALACLEAANAPAPGRWFGQRLPVLWTQFMAARAADPRALTVWMAETARLLGDLPHDILAHSIDEAIKSSHHGFLPSVGEIRAVADSLCNDRDQQMDRLRKMQAALANPDATAARVERRLSAARHAAHMEKLRREQVDLGFEPARP